MFSFRKSCRARTHGTSYDDAQKINFVAIRRVGSVARALTAEILLITLAACIWTSSAHGQVLYGSIVGNVNRDKLLAYAELYRRLGSYPYDQDPLRPGWTPTVPNERWADPNDARQPAIEM